MRGAAQLVGVAITLQEIAPRPRRLRLIDIEFHRQFGIARLQRRVNQVAAYDRVVPAAAERESDMARRMARGRHDARMIADLVIVAHDVGLFGFDDGQHAVVEGRHRLLGVLLGPVNESSRANT